MKKFNKVISITVSIDAIAEKLLATIDPTNPHRELIAEVIIGDLHAAERLSKIYNALNGWRDTIDVEVGKVYECNESVYGYANMAAEGEEPRYENKYVSVGKCKVLTIDEYKERPIEVEYHPFNKNGERRTETKWVHVSSLAAVTN